MKNFNWFFRKDIRFLRVALFLLVTLSACNLPQNGAGQYLGPAVWIDAPKDGMHLPVAPYKIVMHGSDSSAISFYELYVNGELQGNLQDASRGLPSLHYAEYVWEPQAAGDYIIKIRAQNSNGDWGNEDQVSVNVGDFTPEPVVVEQISPTPLFTATLKATATRIPTKTKTATNTPSEAMALLTMNANCRLGPSTQYDVVTSLLQGQQVKVIGYNNDNVKWFYIQLPQSSARCWISSSTVDISGDENAIPYYQAPALPPTSTPSPSPTIEISPSATSSQM